MNRLLPFPLVSLALWVAWLMLNGSAAMGHVVLGAVLAVAIPAVLRPWTAPQPRPRKPLAILRLAAIVLRDIVVSNVQVARLILGPEERIRPGFVRVPLALDEPFAIATLAGIITMTPGTLSCAVAPDRSYLLVHALHLDDADALVADIKARYERALLEIFR
ncbi:MAG TPA: Na+/H+ antiporter subunit E [Casimicrobiaceae bacterium]|nr:Na+/H+ antiporter subunit E [Casimicrobiaceae bacterium]